MLSVAALALGTACAAAPQPRVPPPPMVAGGARGGRAAPPRPHAGRGSCYRARRGRRGGGGADVRPGDLRRRLRDGHGVPAGFGPKLHEDEDTYTLLGLSARPITWSEFGYADADPDLEIAEVVARVQSRESAEAGNVYYKLGFRRTGDKLTIDQASKRTDLR